MNNPFSSSDRPLELTRRSFLKVGTTSTLALGAPPIRPRAAAIEPGLTEALDKLEYLTRPEAFRTFVREKPPIDQFSAEQRHRLGLDREAWQLELVADPASQCELGRPFSKRDDSALTWSGLMGLAEKHAVRFLHVLACTNGAHPFGMGLWEGVPLREVIWQTQPSHNVRRAYYWGYHNEDPKQRFVSSLPVGRVLEEGPGEWPVILCYKLNGQWLAPKNGGPVRLIVPGAYGNKWVKWLQRIELSSDYQIKDTYAQWDNDTESLMKTQARFLHLPTGIQAGQPVSIQGLAQVGVSGLREVQYAIQPAREGPPDNDRDGTQLNWRTANIVPPPEDWGGGLPGGRLPEIPLQFELRTGRPRSWPLPYTWVYWVARVQGLARGRYRLCCRSLDAGGHAQPMPRPFPRSGNNALHEVTLTVDG